MLCTKYYISRAFVYEIHEGIITYTWQQVSYLTYITIRKQTLSTDHTPGFYEIDVIKICTNVYFIF